MLYKPGGDQFLEDKVQSFTWSFSCCHTIETPHRNHLSSFSFLFAFTIEPPTAELAGLWWLKHSKRTMKFIDARDYQAVADAASLLKGNKALKIVLALHTQDSCVIWILMTLSRSGNSSTGLTASVLRQWVFTLIFTTFGFDLYILRPVCLVVLIREFVIAFLISVHSGSKCHSYSHNSGKTSPNNPFLTPLVC